MKKLLGISLFAALAVSPMLAKAADGDPASTITAAESGLASNGTKVITATNGAYYAGKSITADDKAAAASAAYVKGAYNDAISAVNKVHADTTTALAGKQATLGNGDVKEAMIDTGAVTNTKLGAGAVTSAKLATGAVESTNIKDGEVKTDDLAAGAVTNAKLATDAVQSANIKDGEVGFAKLASGAVTTGGSTNNDTLTTKGYVDTQISGLNISNYATKTGVAATVNKATASKTGAQLNVTGSVSGNVPMMVDWGATSASDLALQSGAIVSGAKATGDITGITVSVPGYFANSSATAE